MGTRLYVGNLSYDTTEGSLQELFAKSGTVKSCELATDKFTHRSRGFGFIEMGSEEEAEEAIRQCNGQEFDGRNLTVNEARPRAERSSFGGRSEGGGGGDRGGGGGGGRGRGAPRKSGKGSRRNIRKAKRGGGDW